MAFFSEQDYQNWMDELANTDFVVIDDFIDAQLYETIFSFFDARLKANDLLKQASEAEMSLILMKASEGIMCIGSIKKRS